MSLSETDKQVMNILTLYLNSFKSRASDVLLEPTNNRIIRTEIIVPYGIAPTDLYRREFVQGFYTQLNHVKEAPISPTSHDRESQPQMYCYRINMLDVFENDRSAHTSTVLDPDNLDTSDTNIDDEGTIQSVYVTSLFSYYDTTEQHAKHALLQSVGTYPQIEAQFMSTIYQRAIDEGLTDIFGFIPTTMLENVKVTLTTEQFQSLIILNSTNSNSPEILLLHRKPICTICQDDLQLSDNLRLPCHHWHIFHKTCIRRWLTEYSVKCPICKTDIRDLIKS